MARERKEQGAKAPGIDLARERIGRGPIGRFAPGSEKARYHVIATHIRKKPRTSVIYLWPPWFTSVDTTGLYKPRTGRTGHTGCTGRYMNHASAILAAPALIYSMHRLLVVGIIVAHFHLYSLRDRYTILEVWAVRRPMRVCCGSRRGRCVLFINILGSLTAPCLVYNTAMYTVCGRCVQSDRCMFIHWPVWPVRGL